MKPVLEVENLCFAYDSSVQVLNNISFSVGEGASLGIAGANGAGKSTLLWCILGLLKASGAVRFFGRQLDRQNRARMGVVFQNPEDQLFMPRVADDLTLPLVNRGVPAPEATRRALAALARVALETVADRPATQLSLGERKRAAIASALVTSPELLLLDEPTAELDGRAVRELTALIQSLAGARVIASHDLSFLQAVSPRALVLSGGRIIADGASQQILTDRVLLEQAGLV